jgi:hypothetical protein
MKKLIVLGLGVVSIAGLIQFSEAAIDRNHPKNKYHLYLSSQKFTQSGVKHHSERISFSRKYQDQNKSRILRFKKKKTNSGAIFTTTSHYRNLRYSQPNTRTYTESDYVPATERVQ